MSGLYDPSRIEVLGGGMRLNLTRDRRSVDYSPEIPRHLACHYNIDDVPLVIEVPAVNRGRRKIVLSPGDQYTCRIGEVVQVIGISQSPKKDSESHVEQRTDEDAGMDTQPESGRLESDSDALLHDLLVKKIDRLYEEKFKLSDQWAKLDRELLEVKKAIAEIDQTLFALSYTNSLPKFASGVKK